MDETNDNPLRKLKDFFDAEDDPWEDCNERPVADVDERYQEKRLLAVGGMKEIYQVYDMETQRYVAMAQLKKGGPQWHCESFLKEAYLAASLVHPNIISVYTVGLDSHDAPYFIMELKIGHTLRSLVGVEADVTELLQIFLKVCDAVSYAHSVGVLHLDIKPDNVQVGEHGLVKLCDWGLACRLSDMDQQPDLIRGTPGFMAPEQAQCGEVGCFTDIYSLGALLCFILTGDAPFGGGVNTRITDTLEGDFAFSSKQDVDIEMSASLEAVVKRAMATEWQNRYNSVDALKADVTSFLSGYSTSAENAGLLKECLLFYKRNKASCLVASALLVILGLTVGVSVYNLKQSKNRVEQSLAELKEAHINLQNAKQKEEEAYKKYMGEKVAKIRTSNELRFKKLNDAYSAVLFPIYFTDPVGSIDRSLKILLEQRGAGEDDLIEQQIITNLFISQQFEQIANYSPTSTLPLLKIAERYSAKEKTAEEMLRPGDFVSLLKELCRLEARYSVLKDSLLERMIYFQIAKQRESHIDHKALIVLIGSMNPGWNSRGFIFDARDEKLILSGEELKSICGTASHSSRKCILSLLNLRTLILRKTGISEAFQLSGLTAKRVDISDSQIDSIHPVSVFRGISTLIVRKGQFPDKMPPGLPASLKILER